MDSPRDRRLSDATLVVLLALSVALAALITALRRDTTTSDPVVGHDDRSVAPWRLLPTEADLPDGWSMRAGNVDIYTGGASIDLRGPERLHGYLFLFPGDGGEARAKQRLKDLHDSSNVVPGRSRIDVPTLGDETVVFREAQRSFSGDGPETHVVIFVWRRGAVLAQLRIQDLGPVGLDRSPSKPIDLQLVEDLARRIDTVLAEGLP